MLTIKSSTKIEIYILHQTTTTSNKVKIIIKIYCYHGCLAQLISTNVLIE